MRKRTVGLVLGLALALVAAGQASAQTNTPTPTNTPTNTPTSTFTVIPTATLSASTPTAAAIPTQNSPGGLGVIPEPVRFGAWKYGTVVTQLAGCSSNKATATVTIPGAQVGDFFKFEPQDGSSSDVPYNSSVTQNNTVKVWMFCGTTNDRVTLKFFWWDRTYPDPNKNLGDPGPIL